MSVIEVEVLKLELGISIYMDNELWYGVIESQNHCSYSSLYLSVFLSFQGKFMSGTIKARIFNFG